MDDELNSANELIRDQSKMLAESSVQAQTMEERIKELEVLYFPLHSFVSSCKDVFEDLRLHNHYQVISFFVASANLLSVVSFITIIGILALCYGTSSVWSVCNVI